MLTLSRGGPIVWLSEVDARKAGIADNDWVEAYNANGALVASDTTAPYAFAWDTSALTAGSSVTRLPFAPRISRKAVPSSMSNPTIVALRPR